MILPAKNFVGEFSKGEIEEAAETYGYEGFIPYGFIKDLIYCWTNFVIYEDFTKGIVVENDYDKEFKKFVSMFPQDTDFYKNGKFFVFDVLRRYGAQLNLRAVEASRYTGLPFDLEAEEQFNYNIDLSQIDPEVLEVLGIEEKEPSNEIKLEQELLDILKFLNGLKQLPGTVEEIPQLARERMKSYNQIVKISKHRLVYPTFKYDYTIKSLRAKIPFVERKDNHKMIIVIDVSNSTKLEDKYLLVYKAILLNYYSLFQDGITELEIHYVTDRPKYYKVVKTKKELAELLTTPLSYYVSPENWQASYDFLEKRFEGETIIFLNDGDSYSLSTASSPRNTWNVVTFIDNASLKKLCKRTNGKFIKL